MNRTKKLISILIILLISVFSFFLACGRRYNTQGKKNYYQENIVAGGSRQFMEVRHIIIKGSNYAIGKKIGEIAKKLNVRLQPLEDKIINKIQRKYIRNNYPEFYERMRGFADAYGLDISNNNYDFSHLWIIPSKFFGCSVVFYPKSFTENQHDIMSRNFDFIREASIMSKVYIFELYPDKGYSSLSICAFDLLGGVLDGINSQGLAVAVLGEEETIAKYGNHPSAQGVGMYELLVLRYLLDNCKNVEEAKEALLYLKHYYSFMPCHFIVADSDGKSFIFEFSSFRNSTYIVNGDGPQCITNHPVYKYKSTDDFPEELRFKLNSYDRFRKLAEQIKRKNKFSIEKIIKINNSVANLTLPFENPNYAPNRTLWYSLYDLQELSLKVKFYLGETKDSSAPYGKRLYYSDYLTFKLKKPKNN